MSTVGKTPRRQPDGRLSNLVLEGGKTKKYATRDAQGRFVVASPNHDDRHVDSVTFGGEPEPPTGRPKAE
jgi:hypothetical protein